MKKARIRPLAICIFRRENMIFVAEGFDSSKNETFYRPLGSGIDFGEYAIDTIRRELMEEIKAEVSDLQYLCTLENIFTFEGQQGHEICLVFDGRFVDDALNQDDYVATGLEEEMDNLLFKAYWKPIDLFTEGKAILYPAGLPEFLEKLMT